MDSWQRILTFVEGRVSRQDFTNWFRPTQFKSLHGDNTLLVSVPNRVFEDWLNGYSDLILELFGPEVGAHARSSIGMVIPLNAPVNCEAEVEIDGGER